MNLKEPMMQDSGERREFASGAVRDRGGFKPRPDLISPHANLREGAWLAKGAEKYGVRNYERGMPISECVASLARHLEQYKLGDTIEDHAAAIRTNAGFILHFEEEIKAGRLPADLDDMPHYLRDGGLHWVRNTSGKRIEGGDLVVWDGGVDSGVLGGDKSVHRPIEIDNDGKVRTIGDQQTPTLEQKVQKEVSFILSNPTAFCATETIPKGSYFPIRGHKVLPIGALRIDGDIEAQAIETIPKGAILEYVTHTPAVGDEHWDWEIIPAFKVNNRFPQAGETIEFRDKKVRLVSESSPFTVYLCGPITGEKIDYQWRKEATDALAEHGIRTLDPLRGKLLEHIEGEGLRYKGQLAAPEIADRDALDVEETDVVLAHFPYMPPRQSIGSLMEMGAVAIGLKKPVVLCSKEAVFNEHLFCRNFCILESDFDQALARIVAMAEVRRR